MIIRKRLVHPDAYLQEAGPSRWSLARGRSIQIIIVVVVVVESGELGELDESVEWDEYGEFGLKKKKLLTGRED